MACATRVALAIAAGCTAPARLAAGDRASERGRYDEAQKLFEASIRREFLTPDEFEGALRGLDHRFVHDGRPGSLANTRL